MVDHWAELGPPHLLPVVAQGKVVVATADGQVTCFG